MSKLDKKSPDLNALKLVSGGLKNLKNKMSKNKPSIRDK